ncbi:MAG: hypothetical protein HY260_18775, partial [Chloroflexi bacterium]|nr:hypothetical protein [Chloroflexota bacterium]
YSAAAEWAARIAAEVGKRGLPPHTLLNVNVPALPLRKSKAHRSRGRDCATIATNW